MGVSAYSHALTASAPGRPQGHIKNGTVGTTAREDRWIIGIGKIMFVCYVKSAYQY
jgi:hypothetical protein